MGDIYSHKQAKNLRNLMEGIIWDLFGALEFNW